jgi:hypothetical protein
MGRKLMCAACKAHACSETAEAAFVHTYYIYLLVHKPESRRRTGDRVLARPGGAVTTLT